MSIFDRGIFTTTTLQNPFERVVTTNRDLSNATVAATGADTTNQREMSFVGNPQYQTRTDRALGDIKQARRQKLPATASHDEFRSRVFGNGINPQEPIVLEGVQSLDNISGTVNENDPVNAPAREYFRKQGVTGRIYEAGDSLTGPPEIIRLGTTAYGGAPVYRYNNDLCQDERVDRPVHGYFGALDEMLADTLAQLPPLPFCDRDTINHHAVDIPLEVRYGEPGGVGTQHEAWMMSGNSVPRVWFNGDIVRGTSGRDLYPIQRHEPEDAPGSVAERKRNEIVRINHPDIPGAQPLKDADFRSEENRRVETTAMAYL